MYAQNDVNYVCKNHNVILIILLTLLETLATLLNLLKKSITFKKFHLGSSPGVPASPYAYGLKDSTHRLL